MLQWGRTSHASKKQGFDHVLVSTSNLLLLSPLHSSVFWDHVHVLYFIFHIYSHIQWVVIRGSPKENIGLGRVIWVILNLKCLWSTNLYIWTLNYKVVVGLYVMVHFESLNMIMGLDLTISFGFKILFHLFNIIFYPKFYMKFIFHP